MVRIGQISADYTNKGQRTTKTVEGFMTIEEIKTWFEHQNRNFTISGLKDSLSRKTQWLCLVGNIHYAYPLWVNIDALAIYLVRTGGYGRESRSIISLKSKMKLFPQSTQVQQVLRFKSFSHIQKVELQSFSGHTISFCLGFH